VYWQTGIYNHETHNGDSKWQHSPCFGPHCAVYDVSVFGTIHPSRRDIAKTSQVCCATLRIGGHECSPRSCYRECDCNAPGFDFYGSADIAGTIDIQQRSSYVAKRHNRRDSGQAGYAASASMRKRTAWSLRTLREVMTTLEPPQCWSAVLRRNDRSRHLA
jgi:hypothetical protein